MAKTVAIVGGASLLGRELQDLIREDKLSWNLRLLSGEAEGSGTLTADGEEATYLEPVAAAPLQESQVIFLAGTSESSWKARELHPAGNFIDLTGTFDATALAAPRIGVDPEGPQLVIAHPASIALAFLLSKLDKAGEVERTVTTVLEPASERGHAGIGELQKQSAALLTFKPLPKEVYDAQLAYNVLPEFGEDAPLQLAAIEERIDRELRHLRGDKGHHASVRLVQAPVFHGYSFLTWVRFAKPVSDLEKAFASDPLVDLRSEGVEPPTNAGVTQQDGYQIGAIRRDRADANAYWVWMTCDNLRTAASNAIAAAKQIL